LLALLGCRAPAGIQGRDLFDAAPAGGRLIYAETLYPREEFGWSALYALRDGDLKYIHGPLPELFDLGSDPGERTDLAAARASEVQRLAAALAAEGKQLAKPERLAAAAGLGERGDPEAAERLASLGYLGGTAAAEALPSVEGRSPREALGE